MQGSSGPSCIQSFSQLYPKQHNMLQIRHGILSLASTESTQARDCVQWLYTKGVLVSF